MALARRLLVALIPVPLLLAAPSRRDKELVFVQTRAEILELAPANQVPSQFMNFAVTAETEMGDAVKIVGSSAQLGAWNAKLGLDMSTNEEDYPVWTLSADVALEPNLQYQFVRILANGTEIWEMSEGENREIMQGLTEITTLFGQKGLSQLMYFKVREETAMGDVVKVVGSSVQLGNWLQEGTNGGLDMTTDEDVYPMWFVKKQIFLDPAQDLQFKFVKILPNGTQIWEGPDGVNRHIVQGWTKVDAQFGLLGSVPEGSQKVSFFVNTSNTEVGDKVYIVGDDDQFGNWDPASGVEMLTDNVTFPTWHAEQVEVSFPEEGSVEYKFVIVRANGTAVWEEFATEGNRVLHKFDKSVPREVRAVFGVAKNR